MPQINLSEEFSPKVQERLKMVASTEEIVNHNFKFDGVDTVRLTSIDTMPVQDYVRSGLSRYGTPMDIGDTEQVMVLSKDKAFTGILDKGDIQDQKVKKSANERMIAQTDYVLKPMVEKYRIERMAEKLGTVLVKTDLSETNGFKYFLDMQAALTNALAPRNNRVVLAVPKLLNYLKRGDFIKYSDRSQEMIVKGVIGEADGAKVIEVPDWLMPTGMVALWGNKEATTAVEKLKELVIHENPPGINGNLLEGRLRFDAFVLDTKVPLLGAMYESGTLCAVPTITYTAGSTNTIVLATSTAGATIKYTLDGSDPRDSVTAQTYTAAISTADWSASNGNTKVKAFAFKAGCISSTIGETEIGVATALVRN